MNRTSLTLAFVALGLGWGSSCWAQTPANGSSQSPARNVLGMGESKTFGMSYRQGGVGRVIVEGVEPGGLADKAGLQVGDQILSIGNLPVDAVAGLNQRLRDLVPGETVRASIYRDNKPSVLNLVVPAAVPGRQPSLAASSSPKAPVAQSNVLGMTLNETKAGIVAVIQVSPNSPMAAAGVEAGDMLLSLGGHPASPLTELMPFAVKLVTTEKPGSPIELEVERRGKSLVLSVPPANPMPGASTVQNSKSVPAFTLIIGLVLRDISPNKVSVVNVMPGSPAAFAGIQPADVISAVGRQAVNTSQELMNIVSAARIGDNVEMQVVRGNKPFLTNLTVIPRLIDLTDVTAGQADRFIDRDVSALQQEIVALRRQIQTLEIQLKQVQQAQQNVDESRSERPVSSAQPAPAVAR